MRTHKPLALTALNAPFQHNGKVRLVLVVGAMVSLDGSVIEQEQALWKLVAEVPGNNGSLDEMRPKVKGEVLVSGYAFAPGGAPAPVVAAKLSVGSVQKELWVIGDRTWKVMGPSEPQPFTRMPIAYDRAFGGEGFPENPSGKGAAPVKTASGEAAHPLPNIETPKKLIAAPRDRPPPAGFGPIDPSLPQRIKKSGTYDKKWLETKYPEMPDDFDPTYFNVAPEDQWIDGYWQGGETFVLENMHPSRPRIEGVVPELSARILVTRKGEPAEAGESGFDDVALRCDTLWFLPHEERLIMLFRGGIDVADEDASDVLDIIIGLERRGEPRPIEHYAAVRAKRLDKRMGGMHALRDADLLPEGIRAARSSAVKEMRELTTTEGLAQANMRRRAERELLSARERLRGIGVDPDKHLPKELPPQKKTPERDEIPAFVETVMQEAERAQKDAEVKREFALAELRKVCERAGVDLDKKLARDRAGGPPKFKPDDHIAELKRLIAQGTAITGKPPKNAEKLDDPAFRKQLDEADKAIKDAYRRTAHFAPHAETLGPEANARLRAKVEAAIEAGESLAGVDLTGADLAGLDFSKRDLSGAFLERADLTGCSFREATVERAVFARAKLVGADFHGVRAAGANFGEADLSSAKFTGGADLHEAIFMRASLKNADLTGASLDRAQLSEVKCEGTILTRIKAKGLILFKGDLRGADLREASLAECNFLNVDISGADFSGATVYRTAFLDVTADGARFRSANLDKFRVVKAQRGSSMAGADFRGATMRASNLRGVNLEGADLREADLTSADLSEANLRGASLEGARAADIRLMKTDLTGANVARVDLMNALLGGAVVRGASFEEANVFRADAAKMKGDDKTSFKGANVKQVRVVPERRGDG